MTNDGMMDRDDLLTHLENESQVLRNPLIKKAFQDVDRKDFVAKDYQFEAYEDYPLPTLKGQTISQPTTVAFMIELLDPKPGQLVLDIGAGSGWVSALLGSIVGHDGQVYSLEIVPELVAMAEANLKKYNLPVEIVQADEQTGLFNNGPFDRIIAGATFDSKDDQPIVELLLQLGVGGRMVVPIGESIVLFEKISEDDYYETEYPGFIFVPYIK